MTLLSVDVIDLHKDNERVHNLEDLTKDGIGLCIEQCEELLEKLKDAFYEAEE